jgi:hypothetical protein
MRVLENGKEAEIYFEPDDVLGQYDFFVDVESMSVNNNDQRKQAQQSAITMLTSNPNVSALLATENYQPKFKDLFVTWLEDLGIQGAERYFKEIENPQAGAESPLGGKPGRPVSPAGAVAGAEEAATSGLDQKALTDAISQVTGGGSQQAPEGQNG